MEGKDRHRAEISVEIDGRITHLFNYEVGAFEVRDGEMLLPILIETLTNPRIRADLQIKLHPQFLRSFLEEHRDELL